jgi:AcrR family transcriptional regulator
MLVFRYSRFPTGSHDGSEAANACFQTQNTRSGAGFGHRRDHLRSDRRIIERDGAAVLTTNRIAERAGVAIGTLYGYFPNKHAILLAMARRELEQTQGAIRTVLDTAEPDTADPGVPIARLAIRALIDGFGGRNRLRRALLSAVVA